MPGGCTTPKPKQRKQMEIEAYRVCLSQKKKGMILEKLWLETLVGVDAGNEAHNVNTQMYISIALCTCGHTSMVSFPS